MALIHRASLLVAAVAVAAIAACTGGTARAETCPAPVRTAQPGDRCTAAFSVLQEPGKVDRVSVYVVRFKSLEAADLSSWAVPGAVVVPLDGLQRGLQVAVPLSILSECRP